MSVKRAAWIGGGLLAAGLLAIMVISQLGPENCTNEHYSCWNEGRYEVMEEIEHRVDFPATLKLVDVPLSLTDQPGDPAQARFGVHFEHQNRSGVPVWGRASVRYQPTTCEVLDIWVSPGGGFFRTERED